MFPHIVFIAITAIAITLPLLFFSKGWLLLGRDYFFCLVYAQVLIYLHIAPTFAIFEITEDLKVYYIFVSFACFLFFELPFLWFYCHLVKSFQHKKIIALKPNHVNLLFLAIIFIACSFIFFNVSVENFVFFKRIGPYSLRQNMASLPLSEGFFYRFYFKSALFVAAVFLYATLQARSLYKQFYLLTFFIVGGTIFIYDLVNNRLATLIFIAYLFGIYWFFGSKYKKPILNTSKIALLCFFLGFSVFVVNNLRAGYYERGYWEWTDIFYVENTDNQVTDSLKWRLNGIDLMARITPKWLDTPTFDVEAYQNSFIISFGMAWGSAFSEQRKDDLNTAIKNHLMRKYLDWDIADYYSCSLTDLYGCFNIFGLLFAAFFYSFLIYGATYSLFYTESASLRIFGIFFMPFCLYFEHEFTNLLWNWLKTFPIALIFIVAQVFKKQHAKSFQNLPTNG